MASTKDFRGVNVVGGRFVARPIEERFWEKVHKRGADECWPWLGAVASTSGRGLFAVKKRHMRSAAQTSWSLANGAPFPEGLDACHTCDNPICVNPAHIWPGTDEQNLADCVRKGRHKSGKGETKRYLSREQILDIRRRGDEGESGNSLAKEFGVAQSVAARIIKRETYKTLG